MKRIKTAAVAASIATAVLASQANAASVQVEGSTCAVYLDTPAEASVGYFFTSIYTKRVLDNEGVEAIYLTVAEARDRYREMARLTEADFSKSEYDRFNSPEDIAAFKQVRSMIKRCAESGNHQATTIQSGSSGAAAVAISVLALIVSIVSLAMPFAKNYLPA